MSIIAKVGGVSFLCLQDAGPKLADPNWRVPPAVMPAFGPAMSGQAQEATPPSTPGQSAPGSPGSMPNGLPNGHAPVPTFRFGMPGDSFLSFAGPGGDAFAQGKAFCSSRSVPCDVKFFFSDRQVQHTVHSWTLHPTSRVISVASGHLVAHSCGLTAGPSLHA